MREDSRPPASLLGAALLCRCPRCGEGALYDGVLAVAARCRDCGLDLRAQDAGDGPAVFVILVLGALVVLLAFLVQATVAPPVWVHLLLWPVVVSAGAVLMLRVFKAGLIALQFRHRALGGDTAA